MKKIIVAGVAMMLTIGLMSACGQQLKSDVIESQTAEDSTTEIPNPIKEYETISEMEEAVGFRCNALPESTGYKMESISTIDDEIGQYIYKDKDTSEKEFVVRTGKGNEDISGYYGVEYQEKDIHGTMIHVGILDEDHVAWWTDGTYEYSVSATDITDDDFENCLAELL